jgi:hypothetical protein
MKSKLNGEKAEYLLRFIAALSWADDEVKQSEIDHVMRLAGKSKVPDSVKTDLQQIMTVHHSTSDIVNAYRDLKKRFAGSRNFPTMVDDRGRSAYIPPEEVDKLVTSAVFELLSSDGLISRDEGAVISAIQGLETDVHAAKNIIYGQSTIDVIDADQP